MSQGEKKGQIALKYWLWQFGRPGFQKESQRIKDNADRIARQIGLPSAMDFRIFLRLLDLQVRGIDNPEYWKYRQEALALFAHRLQPVTIGNSLRRWTISFARAIGESDSDCLELVREILTEKIKIHLN